MKHKIFIAQIRHMYQSEDVQSVGQALASTLNAIGPSGMLDELTDDEAMGLTKFLLWVQQTLDYNRGKRS